MSLEQELLEQRLKRIGEIEALGFRPYGSRFDFTHTIPQILAEYGAEDRRGACLARAACASAAASRPCGAWARPASSHLLQNGERLQIYVKKDAVPENDFALYQLLDIGDIIGVEGYLFRTRTGELTRPRRAARLPVEDAALDAREVARPRRRRDALPPALPGPDRQSGSARRSSSRAARSSPPSAASSRSAASSKWRRP